MHMKALGLSYGLCGHSFLIYKVRAWDRSDPQLPALAFSFCMFCWPEVSPVVIFLFAVLYTVLKTW